MAMPHSVRLLKHCFSSKTHFCSVLDMCMDIDGAAPSYSALIFSVFVCVAWKLADTLVAVSGIEAITQKRSVQMPMLDKGSHPALTDIWKYWNWLSSSVSLIGCEVFNVLTDLKGKTWRTSSDGSNNWYWHVPHKAPLQKYQTISLGVGGLKSWTVNYNPHIPLLLVIVPHLVRSQQSKQASAMQKHIRNSTVISGLALLWSLTSVVPFVKKNKVSHWPHDVTKWSDASKWHFFSFQRAGMTQNDLEGVKHIQPTC